MEYDLPAKGSTVRLYNKGFGGDVTKVRRKNGLEPTGLVDKTTSDDINIELDKQKTRSFVIRHQIIKDLKEGFRTCNLAVINTNYIQTWSYRSNNIVK